MSRTESAASALERALGLGALLLAAALTFVLCLSPIYGFDIWWHLKTGEMIVATGEVPRTDPFTFTATGQPWVNHEWLSEVLFYRLFSLGGADLLVIFKALLAALAVGISAMAGLARVPTGCTGRRSDPETSDTGRRSGRWGAGATRLLLPSAALGVLLAGPLLAPRAFVRPHLLTAVLLALTLLLLRLDSAWRDRGRRWIAWLLPLLFLLWANLHSGFVLGFLLVGLYWIAEEWQRRRDIRGRGSTPAQPDDTAESASIATTTAGLANAPRGLRAAWSRPAAILALMAAATLINPNHVEAFLYPFRLVARSEVRETIVELRSIFHPTYRGALFLKVLALTVAAGAAMVAASRRSLVWPVLLPGLVFLGLAVASLRGVSEFAVLVPALFVTHGVVLTRRRSIGRTIAVVVAVLAVAGTWGAVRFGQPMGSEENRRVGLGVVRENRPEGAVRFLKAIDPPEKVFNVLAFGGWIIHELGPRTKVYIDGRLDVFPDGFIRSYRRMMETGDGWDQVVRGHRFSLAVVDYRETAGLDVGLRARLRTDPQWVCVFLGDNALIYAQRVSENTGLIDRYGLPFDPSLRSWESVAAALESMLPEEIEDAAASLEAMMEVAPQEDAPRVVLARLLVFRSDRERAEGRNSEAITALRRAEDLAPEDFLVHLRLGILLAQQGDLGAARGQFEAARRLQPEHPALRRNLEILEALERAQRGGRHQPPP